MQDRQPTYPGRVKLTPVSGQANVYDMERADQPIVEGTALNKANLLPDDVCAALGIPNTSTPADAFQELSALIIPVEERVVGETLLETTISQSGTQLNINVDTTNWGNYQYVFVIIDAALSRADAYMRVRLNNNSTEDLSYCYFNNDFYEMTGDRKYISATRATSANSERTVLCFNVFGSRSNSIVCHTKSTTTYSWGRSESIRYSRLTQINLICTSSKSSIQSGAHIKIVGVK